MLSRLVTAFIPRSKRLLISWLQSPSAVISEPKKIKSLTVFIVSRSICYEVMQPVAMILVFWMLSFKPTFSLSYFTFIKRLFSSSSVSAIRVVSSVYLRLLIFLLAVWCQIALHPAQHFTQCILYMLNKLGVIVAFLGSSSCDWSLLRPRIVGVVLKGNKNINFL